MPRDSNHDTYALPVPRQEPLTQGSFHSKTTQHHRELSIKFGLSKKPGNYASLFVHHKNPATFRAKQSNIHFEIEHPIHTWLIRQFTLSTISSVYSQIYTLPITGFSLFRRNSARRSLKISVFTPSTKQPDTSPPPSITSITLNQVPAAQPWTSLRHNQTVASNLPWPENRRNKRSTCCCCCCGCCWYFFGSWSFCNHTKVSNSSNNWQLYWLYSSTSFCFGAELRFQTKNGP